MFFASFPLHWKVPEWLPFLLTGQNAMLYFGFLPVPGEFSSSPACFVLSSSHSSLARFTTLEQHDKRLERSRKVIVTPDDLPRGTWKLTLAEKELPLMWKLEPKTVINLKHLWFCSHDWDDKSNKWKAESQRFKKEKLDLVLVAKQKKDQPLGEKWDSCRENLELRKGSFLPQLGAVL